MIYDDSWWFQFQRILMEINNFTKQKWWFMMTDDDLW